MNRYLSRRTQFVTLALSAGIHILALLILFTLQQNNDTAVHTQKKHQAMLAQPLAQSKTAQVVFKNEPKPTPPPSAQEKQKKTLPITQDVAKIKSKSVIDIQRAESPEQLNQHLKVVEEIPKAKETAQEIVKKTIQQAEKKVDTLPKHAIQKPTRHRPARRAISLADVTRGFLKSMCNERGAIPTSPLDAHQFVQQQYQTKVWTLLRRSFQADRKPIHLSHEVDTQAMIVLTINKDGSLVTAYLSHPNKNIELRQIEQILAHSAKNVGLYPPLPQQFKTNMLTLRFPLRIKVHEGFHQYDLFYDQ